MRYVPVQWSSIRVVVILDSSYSFIVNAQQGFLKVQTISCKKRWSTYNEMLLKRWKISPKRLGECMCMCMSLLHYKLFSVLHEFKSGRGLELRCPTLSFSWDWGLIRLSWQVAQQSRHGRTEWKKPLGYPQKEADCDKRAVWSCVRANPGAPARKTNSAVKVTLQAIWTPASFLFLWIKRDLYRSLAYPKPISHSKNMMSTVWNCPNVYESRAVNGRNGVYTKFWWVRRAVEI